MATFGYGSPNKLEAHNEITRIPVAEGCIGIHKQPATLKDMPINKLRL